MLTEQQRKNTINWMKALMSGEYIQGYDLLLGETDNSFCCLGVAADILGVEQNKIDGGFIFVPSISTPTYLKEDICKNDILPENFAREYFGEWLGVYQTHLSNLNDEDRLTFTEIAAVISGFSGVPLPE